MNFDALRQETLAPALTAAGEAGAPTFGAHARAKTVLIFSGALGALQGAFHSSESPPRRAKSGYIRRVRSLVNDAHCHVCAFLK